MTAQLTRRRTLVVTANPTPGYPLVVRPQIFPQSTARAWPVRLFVAVLVAAAVVFPGAAPAAAAPCGQSISNQLPDTPWPLRQLRPDLVWPLTRGAGVVVAVIDSGVSKEHPTLAGQVRAGRDFLQPGGNGSCDESGHGTLVAGIIAGKVTPSSGFHGMAPNAAILPVRVLRDQQKSFDKDNPHRIAEAIRWATDNRAKVINLSLFTPRTAELDAAVRYAQDRDVVLVAAAGNEGGGQQGNQATYPAAYPGVIAVAGVDEQGVHVETSTTGNYVAIAAPGKNIEGPAPNGNGYVVFREGGTSFAAAYVTGVVALIRAYRSDLDAASVIRRVLRTADHSAGGWDPDVGYGVVNPYWAVTSIAGTGRGEQQPATLTPPRLESDPLRDVRAAAVWIGVAGVFGAVLMLLAVPVVRRGRRRGWRVGQRPAAATGEPEDRRRERFTPVVGRAMSVTAPSAQRVGGASRPPGGGRPSGDGRPISMPSTSTSGSARNR
jgi:membrane-anchored mycosin MYCP